jgi:hypothetical protein
VTALSVDAVGWVNDPFGVGLTAFPAGRAGHAMVYMPNMNSGTVWVLGGYNATTGGLVDIRAIHYAVSPFSTHLLSASGFQIWLLNVLVFVVFRSSVQQIMFKRVRVRRGSRPVDAMAEPSY